MQIEIKTPKNFNFRRTVLSHGWCVLPPFEFDKKNWTLVRVLGTDKPVTAKILAHHDDIRVDLSRRVGPRAMKRIERDIRHMFRLDDDFSDFYHVVNSNDEFRWIAQEGAGRLLRSPTVFEDLVKMICTPNCSWALTEKMVSGLVNELGARSDDGRRSFPSAEMLAQQPVQFFTDKVRAGYRAPYLRELSGRVASGSLNVEEWLSSELPTKELIKQMKSVKGVGDYSAENLLKLLGRYDGLALDSWTRAQFARLRNHGRVSADKNIARFYARFDSWRGLVLWCDMTRHWLDPENIAKW